MFNLKQFDREVTKEIAFNLHWQDVMGNYDQETMKYGEFQKIRLFPMKEKPSTSIQS